MAVGKAGIILLGTLIAGAGLVLLSRKQAEGAEKPPPVPRPGEVQVVLGDVTFTVS